MLTVRLDVCKVHTQMYSNIDIHLSSIHTEPPLVHSNYIVCVWSFMIFKWGITTYLYAIRSFKYIRQAVIDNKPVSGKAYNTL